MKHYVEGYSEVKVLVVDDSPVDRALVMHLLRNLLNCQVSTAVNGVAALEAIEASLPDVVVTDLQMPEMDGLALVEAVRRNFPCVPTILMTAHGSEEIALAALKSGAASYVNKRSLAATVGDTVVDVLSVSRVNREQLRLHECWLTTQFEFEVENDTSLIPVLVNHLQQYLASVRSTDETEVVRVGVALHEALRNAIHHGNLELSSQLRHAEPEAYYHLAAQRQRQEPYCARRVYLQAREARDESQYIIRDEGSGFNVSQLDYDPTNHGNLHIPSGRGLFLIRTFMDEVRFNSLGNEITMIHRRNTRGGQTDSALAG